MKNFLCHIISLGILTPSFSDKVLTSCQSFLQPNAQLIKIFSLFMIDQVNDKRLDNFHITKYPDLTSVVKLVLTLSHGQASVEMGFSVNKAIITDNISTDSIVGKRLLRDYMLTNNLNSTISRLHQT